ncbi:RCKP-type rubredoxin-like domain-containing protein [Desulforamulus putei]
MAVWKCQKCGATKEGRCRPQKCVCGGTKEDFVKDEAK